MLLLLPWRGRMAAGAGEGEVRRLYNPPPVPRSTAAQPTSINPSNSSIPSSAAGRHAPFLPGIL